MMTAPEQALSTTAIEGGVYHIRQDPRCRLWKETSVQHTVAWCKMQAGTAYIRKCHDKVAGIVCRNICAEYGLEVRKSKWEISPKVVENDTAKIQWDFQIQTDKQVMAHQPLCCLTNYRRRQQ